MLCFVLAQSLSYQPCPVLKSYVACKQHKEIHKSESEEHHRCAHDQPCALIPSHDFLVYSEY
jgi:hypothetical protein